MINKKVSRILGSVLGVMGFMLTIVVLEVPALADAKVQTNYSEGISSDEYKDHSISINKSVQQNGIKVTIDKVIGTKHRIKVIVKVENEKPFDDSTTKNLTEKITFGRIDNNGYSSSFNYPDDKTILITTTLHNDKDEYPEKGDLRVDMVMQNCKVNIGIDAAVDFSNLYNNVVEKDISVKIPELNFTLNKLESDVMGTKIIYSVPKQDYFMNSNYLDDIQKTVMILKVGDKMYPLRQAGNYHSGNVAENNLIMRIFESEAANYDRIKDQKDIKVIPITCNMTDEETNKISENSSKTKEKRDDNKETMNNVSYTKAFEFSDGSKGQICNIERNENIVKVYCKGNSEKESLLMAATMNIKYAAQNSNSKYSLNYDSSKHMRFYKDSKDAFGYVVEFDNVEKDKVLELESENIISQIDKFTVGNEIKIS